MVECDVPAFQLQLAGDLKPADYMKLARTIGASDGIPGLRPLRVALLSSYSFSFVDPFLVVEGARRGFKLECYYGRFGQFEQELTSAESSLSQFAPDVLVLAMRPEDIDPEAVYRCALGSEERFAVLTRELTERLCNCVRTFRERHTAPVFVANFAVPHRLPLGIFDAQMRGSMRETVGAANVRLRELIAQDSHAFIWDYAGLVHHHGAQSWTDARLWALARIPIAGKHQPEVAAHLSRTIGGVLATPAKCLVLDLDDTLWGGVIGDDGLEGIELGDDYPGNVYKSFQRRILSLHDRGVLLAVVSKNDRDVAEAVFRRHPEMLIRWDDLATVRINWAPKSANILEIADELNMGQDALVLFDDNSVERAEVRVNAPDVKVIEVPPDPLRFESALWDCPYFDQPSLSSEDRARPEIYRHQTERRRLARQYRNVDDFLVSLDLMARVAHADAATLGRIAQLIGKTNQFNLTTRRYNRGEIAAMCEDRNQVVAWLRLRDRFDDHGLVVVGILQKEEDTAHLDTFLMSCRVMNRRVEQAFLSYLADEARRLGCSHLVGEFRPTKRNGIVRDFYPSLGFAPNGTSKEGAATFVLDLASQRIEWPAVIALDAVA